MEPVRDKRMVVVGIQKITQLFVFGFPKKKDHDKSVPTDLTRRKCKL